MARLAAFLVALLLLAAPVRAAQDDPRLDDLFERLRATPSTEEARSLEGAIWRLWMIAGSEQGNLTLREGLAAMSRQDYDRADEAFSRVVELEPGFAEGWNKRATVRFLMFDYAGSVIDIER